jgi:hypothetical protein
MEPTEQIHTHQPAIRAAADLREKVAMAARIKINNQLRALADGADNAAGTKQEKYLLGLLETVETLESQSEKLMVEIMKGHVMFEPLTNIRGVGPVMAARIISQIDITKVSKVSALWKWAGLAVSDGKADRPKKGEKLSYNPRLKSTMFLFSDVQIKTRGPYREDYDRAKEQYQKSHPDKTPKHIHMMAMRKASKLFLSHLWTEWRTAEGLPVEAPYIHTVGGHTNIITPQERGWKM